MSPQETAVPTLDNEAHSAEKPKAVRRRRVTKTDDAEQPTLLADVSADTSAPEKPNRAPRRVAAKKTAVETTDSKIEVGATPVFAAENQTSAPIIETRFERAAPLDNAPSGEATLQNTPDFGRVEPANFNGSARFDRGNRLQRERRAEQEDAENARQNFERQNANVERTEIETASPERANFEDQGTDSTNQGNESEQNGRDFQARGMEAPRDGAANRDENFRRQNNVPRDESPRTDNRGERFGGRDNFSRDNRNQNGENGNAERSPNGQSGQNGGDEGEGERLPDGRLRFRPERNNRNQLRRERNNNNRNGRFERPENGGFNPQQNQPRRREIEILGLQAMERPELEATAAEFSLDLENLPEEKDALIYALLEAQALSQNAILKRGTLEILPDGKGFLRCEGYLPADGDVYVSQSQIKRFNLKTGDLVLGTVRTPKEMERFHGLLRVESINGLSTEEMKTRKDFEKLTPIFPTEKFVLETEATNITARIIDLISPIGKGSRGLIVAPPKAGKTTLIKNIANSIAKNHPEIVLIVLLIDERPEEVTDISRSTTAEVVASTFDEMPDNHMRVADIVLEKAKRLVEMKRDVVILMDSITRLSRASNLVVAPSGRTLSGGLDPAAMYRPKRMFGAARNIEEGGSLTILATALVDTGSRMDEMIFEEFKGTGNLDLVLDRNLFDQRIFPAIDINRSGTRRDDLLLGKEDLATIYHLRRTLAQLDNDKAVTLLIDRLKNTRSNLDFMGVVAKSARNTGQGAG